MRSRRLRELRDSRRTLMVLLGGLCVTLSLALASCASGTVSRSTPPASSASPSAAATTGSTPATSASPASSATPRSVAAFSCAAGSLPVNSGSTQTSCVVTTAHGLVLVTATYTFTSPGPFVDEPALRAAGWVLAGLVNEDGPGFSGTWFLYLQQGAWISWGPTPDGKLLGVWAGVPVHGEPIGCGRTITGVSAPHVNVPLPQGTQTVALFLLAPFCLQDVESFYTTTLTAAGWAADGPFQVSTVSAATAATASATFTRQGVSVHLSLLGADGTPTRIIVN